MASLQKQVQAKAYRLVRNQFLVLSVISLGALLGFGKTVALSVWVGGLCYVLPNFAFVFFVFKFAAPTDVYKFLAAFLGGEMVKIILSAILMILVVNTMPLGLSSVIAGFIIAIVSFWVVCFIQFSKREGIQA